MNQITAHITLRKNRIQRNGTEVFACSQEIPAEQFLEEAYTFLKSDYPKFYKMDLLSKLGFIGSEVLLTGRRLKDEFPAGKTAVILSNASSSLETDRRYFNSTRQLASPSLFVYTLPNIVAGEICIRHGLKGENGFFISEEFDADFMTTYVEGAIARGASVVIAGWIEISGSDNDVFLYLTEKEKTGNKLNHTTENVSQLYIS